MVIFYVLSPLPIIISKRCVSDSYMSDPYTGRCIELCGFLTSIIVVSAYALPAIMASSIPNPDQTLVNKQLISWGSAGNFCLDNKFNIIFGSFISFFFRVTKRLHIRSQYSHIRDYIHICSFSNGRRLRRLVERKSKGKDHFNEIIFFY